MKFKAGDKVRVSESIIKGYDLPSDEGKILRISRRLTLPYRVCVEGRLPIWLSESDLTPITPKLKFKVGDKVKLSQELIRRHKLSTDYGEVICVDDHSGDNVPYRVSADGKMFWTMESRLANARKFKLGDIVVVSDSDGFFGIGRIYVVSSSPESDRPYGVILPSDEILFCKEDALSQEFQESRIREYIEKEGSISVPEVMDLKPTAEGLALFQKHIYNKYFNHETEGKTSTTRPGKPIGFLRQAAKIEPGSRYPGNAAEAGGYEATIEPGNLSA